MNKNKFSRFLLSTSVGIITTLGISEINALTASEQAGMDAFMANQAANIQEFTDAGKTYYQNQGFVSTNAQTMASNLANQPSGYKYLNRLKKQGLGKDNYNKLFAHFKDLLVSNVPLTSNHFDNFWAKVSDIETLSLLNIDNIDQLSVPQVSYNNVNPSQITTIADAKYYAKQRQRSAEFLSAAQFYVKAADLSSTNSDKTSYAEQGLLMYSEYFIHQVARNNTVSLDNVTDAEALLYAPADGSDSILMVANTAKSAIAYQRAASCAEELAIAISDLINATTVAADKASLYLKLYNAYTASRLMHEQAAALLSTTIHDQNQQYVAAANSMQRAIDALSNANAQQPAGSSAGIVFSGTEVLNAQSIQKSIQSSITGTTTAAQNIQSNITGTTTALAQLISDAQAFAVASMYTLSAVSSGSDTGSTAVGQLDTNAAQAEIYAAQLKATWIARSAVATTDPNYSTLNTQYSTIFTNIQKLLNSSNTIYEGLSDQRYLVAENLANIRAAYADKLYQDVQDAVTSFNLAVSPNSTSTTKVEQQDFAAIFQAILDLSVYVDGKSSVESSLNLNNGSIDFSTLGITNLNVAVKSNSHLGSLGIINDLTNDLKLKATTDVLTSIRNAQIATNQVLASERALVAQAIAFVIQQVITQNSTINTLFGITTAPDTSPFLVNFAEYYLSMARQADNKAAWEAGISAGTAIQTLSNIRNVNALLSSTPPASTPTPADVLLTVLSYAMLSDGSIKRNTATDSQNVAALDPNGNLTGYLNNANALIVNLNTTTDTEGNSVVPAERIQARKALASSFELAVNLYTTNNLQVQQALRDVWATLEDAYATDVFASTYNQLHSGQDSNAAILAGNSGFMNSVLQTFNQKTDIADIQTQLGNALNNFNTQMNVNASFSLPVSSTSFAFNGTATQTSAQDYITVQAISSAQTTKTPQTYTTAPGQTINSSLTSVTFNGTNNTAAFTISLTNPSTSFTGTKLSDLEGFLQTMASEGLITLSSQTAGTTYTLSPLTLVNPNTNTSTIDTTDYITLNLTLPGQTAPQTYVTAPLSAGQTIGGLQTFEFQQGTVPSTSGATTAFTVTLTTPLGLTATLSQLETALQGMINTNTLNVSIPVTSQSVSLADTATNTSTVTGDYISLTLTLPGQTAPQTYVTAPLSAGQTIGGLTSVAFNDTSGKQAFTIPLTGFTGTTLLALEATLQGMISKNTLNISISASLTAATDPTTDITVEATLPGQTTAQYTTASDQVPSLFNNINFVQSSGYQTAFTVAGCASTLSGLENAINSQISSGNINVSSTCNVSPLSLVGTSSNTAIDGSNYITLNFTLPGQTAPQTYVTAPASLNGLTSVTFNDTSGKPAFTIPLTNPLGSTATLSSLENALQTMINTNTMSVNLNVSPLVLAVSTLSPTAVNTIDAGDYIALNLTLPGQKAPQTYVTAPLSAGQMISSLSKQSVAFNDTSGNPAFTIPLTTYNVIALSDLRGSLQTMITNSNNNAIALNLTPSCAVSPLGLAGLGSNTTIDGYNYIALNLTLSGQTAPQTYVTAPLSAGQTISSLAGQSVTFNNTSGTTAFTILLTNFSGTYLSDLATSLGNMINTNGISVTVEGSANPQQSCPVSPLGLVSANPTAVTTIDATDYITLNLTLPGQTAQNYVTAPLSAGQTIGGLTSVAFNDTHGNPAFTIPLTNFSGTYLSDLETALQGMISNNTMSVNITPTVSPLGLVNPNPNTRTTDTADYITLTLTLTPGGTPATYVTASNQTISGLTSVAFNDTSGNLAFTIPSTNFSGTTLWDLEGFLQGMVSSGSIAVVDTTNTPQTCTVSPLGLVNQNTNPSTTDTTDYITLTLTLPGQTVPQTYVTAPASLNNLTSVAFQQGTAPSSSGTTAFTVTLPAALGSNATLSDLENALQTMITNSNNNTIAVNLIPVSPLGLVVNPSNPDPSTIDTTDYIALNLTLPGQSPQTYVTAPLSADQTISDLTSVAFNDTNGHTAFTINLPTGFAGTYLSDLEAALQGMISNNTLSVNITPSSTFSPLTLVNPNINTAIDTTDYITLNLTLPGQTAPQTYVTAPIASLNNLTSVAFQQGTTPSATGQTAFTIPLTNFSGTYLSDLEGFLNNMINNNTLNVSLSCSATPNPGTSSPLVLTGAGTDTSTDANDYITLNLTLPGQTAQTYVTAPNQTISSNLTSVAFNDTNDHTAFTINLSSLSSLQTALQNQITNNTLNVSIPVTSPSVSLIDNDISLTLTLPGQTTSATYVTVPNQSIVIGMTSVNFELAADQINPAPSASGAITAFTVTLSTPLGPNATLSSLEAALQGSGNTINFSANVNSNFSVNEYITVQATLPGQTASATYTTAPITSLNGLTSVAFNDTTGNPAFTIPLTNPLGSTAGWTDLLTALQTMISSGNITISQPISMSGDFMTGQDMDLSAQKISPTNYISFTYDNSVYVTSVIPSDRTLGGLDEITFEQPANMNSGPSKSGPSQGTPTITITLQEPLDDNATLGDLLTALRKLTTPSVTAGSGNKYPLLDGTLARYYYDISTNPMFSNPKDLYDALTSKFADILANDTFYQSYAAAANAWATASQVRSDWVNFSNIQSTDTNYAVERKTMASKYSDAAYFEQHRLVALLFAAGYDLYNLGIGGDESPFPLTNFTISQTLASVQYPRQGNIDTLYGLITGQGNPQSLVDPTQNNGVPAAYWVNQDIWGSLHRQFNDLNALTSLYTSQPVQSSSEITLSANQSVLLNTINNTTAGQYPESELLANMIALQAQVMNNSTLMLNAAVTGINDYTNTTPQNTASSSIPLYGERLNQIVSDYAAITAEWMPDFQTRLDNINTLLSNNSYVLPSVPTGQGPQSMFYTQFSSLTTLYGMLPTNLMDVTNISDSTLTGQLMTRLTNAASSLPPETLPQVYRDLSAVFASMLRYLETFENSNLYQNNYLISNGTPDPLYIQQSGANVIRILQRMIEGFLHNRGVQASQVKFVQFNPTDTVANQIQQVLSNLKQRAAVDETLRFAAYGAMRTYQPLNTNPTLAPPSYKAARQQRIDAVAALIQEGSQDTADIVLTGVGLNNGTADANMKAKVAHEVARAWVAKGGAEAERYLNGQTTPINNYQLTSLTAYQNGLTNYQTEITNLMDPTLIVSPAERDQRLLAVYQAIQATCNEIMMLNLTKDASNSQQDATGLPLSTNDLYKMINTSILNQGQILYRQGNKDQALELLSNTVNNDDGSDTDSKAVFGPILNELASQYEGEGNFLKAADCYRLATSHHVAYAVSDFAISQATLGQTNATITPATVTADIQTAFDAATNALNDANYSGSIATYITAANAFKVIGDSTLSQFALPIRVKAEAYHNEAQAYIGAGMYDMAATAYEKSGSQWSSMGNHAQAALELEKAVWALSRVSSPTIDQQNTMRQYIQEAAHELQIIFGVSQMNNLVSNLPTDIQSNIVTTSTTQQPQPSTAEKTTALIAATGALYEQAMLLSKTGNTSQIAGIVSSITNWISNLSLNKQPIDGAIYQNLANIYLVSGDNSNAATNFMNAAQAYYTPSANQSSAIGVAVLLNAVNMYANAASAYFSNAQGALVVSDIIPALTAITDTMQPMGVNVTLSDAYKLSVYLSIATLYQTIVLYAPDQLTNSNSDLNILLGSISGLTITDVVSQAEVLAIQVAMYNAQARLAQNDVDRTTCLTNAQTALVNVVKSLSGLDLTTAASADVIAGLKILLPNTQTVDDDTTVKVNNYIAMAINEIVDIYRHSRVVHFSGTGLDSLNYLKNLVSIAEGAAANAYTSAANVKANYDLALQAAASVGTIMEFYSRTLVQYIKTETGKKRAQDKVELRTLPGRMITVASNAIRETILGILKSQEEANLIKTNFISVMNSFNQVNAYVQGLRSQPEAADNHGDQNLVPTLSQSVTNASSALQASAQTVAATSAPSDPSPVQVAAQTDTTLTSAADDVANKAANVLQAHVDYSSQVPTDQVSNAMLTEAVASITNTLVGTSTDAGDQQGTIVTTGTTDNTPAVLDSLETIGTGLSDSSQAVINQGQ